MDVIPAVSDLLIAPESVQAVQSWLDECRPGHVLVITSASPGCGVTTMLASLDRARSDVAMYRDEPLGSGWFTVLHQKKIQVIDPLDEYMADQSKQKHVTSIIEQRRVPIIIMGIRRRVSRAKIDDAFGTISKRKGVTRLHIPAPETDRAVSILGRLGIENAKGVWDACRGDFRHCLASTQMPDSTDPARFVKTTFPDGLEALTCLLGPPQHTYPDAVRMTDGDVNLLIDGVFENYTDGVASIEDAGSVLDALEAVDSMQEYIYHDPSSEFPELSGILAGIEFLPVHVQRDITKHGTVWAKENHKYTKAKLYRGITARGIHPETIAWIREFVCHHPATQAPRLAEAYGASTIWNASRLWMKTASRASYTKARHESLTGGGVQAKKRTRPR